MSKGKVITISHDPFARQEIVRRTIPKGERCGCGWCGQPAKFEYGTSPDGLMIRNHWAKGEFCSVGCFRSYHS